MHQWLQSVVDICRKRNDDMIAFDEDPLTRSINLKQHCFGEFSMANVQANEIMEDQSQVEVASHNALYLGVYDGHGGFQASFYVLNNLFHNLLRFAHENDNAITEATLRDAVSDTERGLLEFVKANIVQMPLLGKVGSCCLAGAIWKGVLYVANLGDSRAVICSVVNKKLHVDQLTRDHNCSDEAIRQELRSLHPDDPTIVIEKNGWRVKGIIMVSRSIGDAYLKRPDFSLLDTFPKYETVPPPFTRGVVSAEPEMFTRAIADTDKFLIFASDGLWELMSNEEAAEIVHKNPRHGIAKRILSTALAEAARRLNITYRLMQTAPLGRQNLSRRTFHDDISVIVVFLDNTTHFRKQVLNLSYIGSNDQIQPSEFEGSRLIDTTMKSFTARSLNSFIKKRFKGSKGQSSRTAEGQSSRTPPEGLSLLDMGESYRSRTDRDDMADESSPTQRECDQSSPPKSRWNKLKKLFTPKKH